MTRAARILLVEDDEVHSRVLGRWLETAGYQVTIAAGAAQALALRHARWDILVSDIDLPDGSGVELAAAFKTADPALPVLLLTANGEVDIALQALRARVDDLMLKRAPLRAEALCERIAALLATRAAPATRVLAIGAHPDDIELGCGATLARHAEQGHAITILTLAASADGCPSERRLADAELAASRLGAPLVVGGDGALTESDRVALIERVVASFEPTTIYAHSEHDAHADHRAAHRAALLGTRGVPTFLCFQSATSTIDFRPTMFVDVTHHVERKMELLEVQATPPGRRPHVERDLVIATSRYWGRFASTRHAEPFQVVRTAA